MYNSMGGFREDAARHPSRASAQARWLARALRTRSAGPQNAMHVRGSTPHCCDPVFSVIAVGEVTFVGGEITMHCRATLGGAVTSLAALLRRSPAPHDGLQLLSRWTESHTTAYAMQIGCRAATSCAVLKLSMLVMPDLVCADSVRSCELVRDEFEHVRCIL